MGCIEQLRGVGLRARKAEQPFARGQNATIVFGLDIGERDSDHEHFRLWQGEGNDVRIVAKDRDCRQAVLRVDEPERTFLDEQFVASAAAAEEFASTHRVRLVNVEGGEEGSFERIAGRSYRATFERRTPPETRDLLLGMDERHYFVCTLPGIAESVEAAHDILRPPEARANGTKRQGEWFFVPLTAEQDASLHSLLRRGKLLVRPNGVILGPAEMRGARFVNSTPHVADHLVWNPVPVVDIPRGTEFVRGVIRQAPRHAPLDLGNRFHRVVKNREVEDAFGVHWID